MLRKPAKHIFIFLLQILFVSALYAQKPFNAVKLDSLISASAKDWQMPGFAVAIVKNDSVIFAKGYGTCEAGKNEPVDKNTLFVIASVTKAFTAAGLGILVDEGKLNWDDRVTDYLKDFQMYDSWVTHEIQIRDLLTHRSGLATFSGDMLWLGSDYSRKEVIRRARFLKPVSSFRTQYGYQNIMFSTAGEIIPAVTDTSWDDFIKARIFVPLGMKRTNTHISIMKKMDNIAHAHEIKDGKATKIQYYDVDNVAPAAAINSSVFELAQWIRLQLGKGMYKGKRIFSTKVSNDMWANQFAFRNSNYGFGWFINYYKGKKVLDHSGGMPGFISELALVPEENFGFVILSNAESYMPFEIKNEILDMFLGGEEKDWHSIMKDGWEKRIARYKAEDEKRDSTRVKYTKSSLPLDEYTGIYEDKMYGEAKVTLVNGELYLQFSHSPTFGGKLMHWQFDQFVINWKDVFLTRGYVKFDLNFDGSIKQFTIEVPNSPDFIFTELLFNKKSNL